MRRKKKVYIPEIENENSTGYGTLIIGGVLFNIRILERINRIDFGLATEFDRWANSTDFYTTLPRNEKHWKKKLNNLLKNMKRLGDNWPKGIEI
jgi:hypothetical protein